MTSDGPGGIAPIADHGPGAQVMVESLPPVTGTDEQNTVTAAVEIVPVDLATGAVLTIVRHLAGLGCAGSAADLFLRRSFMASWSCVQPVITSRTASPCRNSLMNVMPGTEIPKNFASRITLIDPERSVDREVLIYMNHPLRYRGETFYQSGFQKDDSATILQVVRNPSFLAPYVACIVVAAGLLFQFGFHLVGFARRRPSLA